MWLGDYEGMGMGMGMEVGVEVEVEMWECGSMGGEHICWSLRGELKLLRGC